MFCCILPELFSGSNTGFRGIEVQFYHKNERGFQFSKYSMKPVTSENSGKEV